MVTSLVPANNGAVASPMGGALEGVEGFSRSDLRIPVLKVVQGTSRMEGADSHIGQFYDTITQEFTPTIDVVILRSRHTRAKFEVGGDSDRPECVSRDCVTGSKFGACARCEWNAQIHQELWRPENAADRCSLGYYLMLLLPDAGLPASFTAQKTNTNAVRTINTLTLAKRLPIWGYTWTFSTVRRTEGNKKWYELVARTKKVNTPEEIAEYREYGLALDSAAVEEVEEASATTVPDDDPPPDDAAPEFTAEDSPF